jgi:hypothetical protein
VLASGFVPKATVFDPYELATLLGQPLILQAAVPVLSNVCGAPVAPSKPVPDKTGLIHVPVTVPEKSSSARAVDAPTEEIIAPATSALAEKRCIRFIEKLHCLPQRRNEICNKKKRRI